MTATEDVVVVDDDVWTVPLSNECRGSNAVKGHLWVSLPHSSAYRHRHSHRLLYVASPINVTDQLHG